MPKKPTQYVSFSRSRWMANVGGKGLLPVHVHTVVYVNVRRSGTLVMEEDAGNELPKVLHDSRHGITGAT